MNAKRVTALIMASVMAFGITACGTGSKEENTKETAQETAAEEATEAVAETVGEEAATAEEAIEDEVEENVETASEMATEASLEDADEKESRNGFNEETNVTMQVGDFEFQIPDYAISDENRRSDYTAVYALEGQIGNASAMLVLLTAGEDGQATTKEEVAASAASYYQYAAEQVGFADAQFEDNYFTSAADDGTEVWGKVELFVNDNTGKVGFAVLVQAVQSDYDYESDFDQICDTAVYLVPEE